MMKKPVLRPKYGSANREISSAVKLETDDETYDPTNIATGSIKTLTVKEVARRLGVSVSWVREYFRKVPGVIVLPHARTGRMARNNLYLIPEDVFLRELNKFTLKRRM